MGIYEQYPPCTWQPDGGQPIAFPVEDIDESGGNRLVAHERPHRDGARHDDTGSRPKRWTLTCVFFNGHEEPGVAGDELYPDTLNALIDSADVHETGTLTIPTRGRVRCRFSEYQRRESFGERDASAVTFVFVEDNEDGVTAEAFTAPSARSVAVPKATETTFSLESAGVIDDDVVSLSELASGLESLAAAPGELVDDLETQAKKIDNACARIENAFTAAADRAVSDQERLLAAPENSPGLRQTRLMRDLAARAVAERLSAQPRIVTRVYPRDVSLIGVAAELSQDLQRLLELNRQYADPFRIPAGKPVRVVEVKSAYTSTT